MFSLATLLGDMRLKRLARLNRPREACKNLSCPHGGGNACRLVPELDATSRRGAHGEVRVAPAHRVPEVHS